MAESDDGGMSVREAGRKAILGWVVQHALGLRHTTGSRV